MAFDNGGPNLSILSISTILTCIKMWMKFRFVNSAQYYSDVITCLVSIASKLISCKIQNTFFKL
jgi:hypothetical protein